ncbi:MAG: OmpA family protein [Flavobacteriales bacterium]|nr:OmpA family protein [Flavobacteriales bacterium]
MRILLLFFFLSLNLFAQETTRSRKAAKIFREAKSAVAVKDYRSAKVYLEQALMIDSRFVEAWILLGDVSMGLGDKQGGIEAYRKSIPVAPRFSFPMYYRLAIAEHSLGYYSEALQHIRKYLSFKKVSEKYRKKANALKKSCEFSIVAMKNPVTFNPENLGENVNTEADEYLPALSADGSTLIFTRSKRVDGSRNEDFYLSLNDTEGWSFAKNLGQPINTLQNEGAQCITADGKTLYFTACSRQDSYGRCDLYSSDFVNGYWTEPLNLGENINSESWESQPAISSDGRQLFFVSNRTGGIGGKDIWVSYKNAKGNWTQAKNLGKDINTAKDDISPFLHWDNQTLYFSSRGYVGMGGFDVFLSRLDEVGHWGTVKNMGYPINSPSDENSLIVAKDGRTAYFASAYFQEGRIDLDLYTFDLPVESRAREVAYIQGGVIDAKSKKPLEAEIELVDLESNRSYKSSRSDVGGDFMFCLPSEAEYALTVLKKNYLFYSENIKMEQEGTILVKNFKLQPIEVGEQVRLDNIFFEVNSFDLKDESATELNKILQFMESNPFVTVEIAGHTDNSGSQNYNLALSEQRAKSVKNVLLQRGLPSDRIQTKGYGMMEPLNSNTTEQERAENRRTELKIIAIE